MAVAADPARVLVLITEAGANWISREHLTRCILGGGEVDDVTLAAVVRALAVTTADLVGDGSIERRRDTAGVISYRATGAGR